MIRGYNFPSGTAEKVTIDGNKVTEKMNLYSFLNLVILDINAPTKPSGYTYQGKLYDGSKLYMKTTLTTIRDGSTNSSDGCTGTVLLIKPDGTQLSVAIPTYTIPTERSETGTDPDLYEYSCVLSPSPDGDIYLRLLREFQDIRGSNTFDHATYYLSIYKLNIYSSSLTWTTKAIEITLGSGKYAESNFIIENNYIYVCSGDSSFTRYIYGYNFGDTSYTFQKISTNSIYNSSYSGSDTIFFARKGTNTYIYFWSNDPDILINEWISVTRNSDGTYGEASGTSLLNHQGNDRYGLFMLNNEIYIQRLEPNKGADKHTEYNIYKLNSDNSDWEVIFNIANITTNKVSTSTYINNTPDIIYLRKTQTINKHSYNVFDLIKFSPGTLDYSLIPTLATKTDNGDWYYYDYKCNDTGQQFFFFEVHIDDEYHGHIIKYRCVIEFINDDPVLYSTFRESDIKII